MTLTLTNEHLEATLSTDTGALIGLLHRPSGWQLLGQADQGQSFRLLTPLEGRRNNPVHGNEQDAPSFTRLDDSVSFTWETVRSRFGGTHRIAIGLTYSLLPTELVVQVEIRNDADVVVENVYAPYLGDVRPPDDRASLESISYSYGTALVRPLWPQFENTPGYYGVDTPTQLADGTASYGTPSSPFTLVQSGDRGLHIGVRSNSTELVVWHAELTPGWGDSLESRVPATREIGGRPVALRIAAVHLPYILPGESRTLTPVALSPYEGDWHSGADIYTRWRDTWITPVAPPEWAAAPHSWQQIQINSAEDELRMPFAELVAVGQECADRGIAAIQLVGWNHGGQDRNNPSHDAEPRLGGADELAAAITAIQALGVKVVIFTKFTWADRSTTRFREELIHQAIKDPYGDYYQHPGYRYETVTQLLDINTRRLIPLCFNSEAYLSVCSDEFAKVVALGANGILFDESLHHMPALLCFDTSHGHRLAAPVYANDRELIHRFRRQIGDDRFLFAGEACYDWQFDAYQVSYHRSENPRHLPMSRYLAPHAQIMTAVTGFDDRNMLNQCLLYRYIISYEPFNFKGRLPDFPATVAYGQAVDSIRTELREWFWDSTFQDTIGGTVLNVTDPHQIITHRPYAIYRHADGQLAAVVANYDPEKHIRIRIRLDNTTDHLRYRIVDGSTEWRNTARDITLPPRTACVVIPS